MTPNDARRWFKQFNTLDHMSKFSSPEEFYQALKVRLMDELVADVHGTSHYGLLTDKPRGDESGKSA